MRDVVDAILYLLRTGCQWCYLPIDFPPICVREANLVGGYRGGVHLLE